MTERRDRLTPQAIELMLAELRKALESRMGELEKHLGGRIEALEGRTGAVENRIGEVERRLKDLGGRIDALEGRMGGVENRIGEVERRLEDLGGRIEVLENRIDRMRIDLDDLRNDLWYRHRLGSLPAAQRPLRAQSARGDGLLSGARDDLVDIPPYVE